MPPEPRRPQIKAIISDPAAGISRENAPTQAVTGFEKLKTDAGLMEVMGGGQPGEATADDQDGRVHGVLSIGGDAWPNSQPRVLCLGDLIDTHVGRSVQQRLEAGDYIGGEHRTVEVSLGVLRRVEAV